jgi:tRNA U34 5-carboxymethylaminomethyl modifying GTPase MnmE/TrmE
MDGVPSEFVAAELRLALDALLEVTGEWAPRAILDEIFGSFCIGK